jgi:hypothetical protein
MFGASSRRATGLYPRECRRARTPSGARVIALTVALVAVGGSGLIWFSLKHLKERVSRLEEMHAHTTVPEEASLIEFNLPR